jgi:hypothetical protein
MEKAIVPVSHTEEAATGMVSAFVVEKALIDGAAFRAEL